MGQLTWIPDVLRDAGLNVYVMPGALERTTYSRSGRRRTMPARPPGVIWHHTATSRRWADGHVAALLRDGRRDLRGPLAQIGVERDGTIVVVACGRANHDGYGIWENDSIGWEFYNAGDGEDPWPAVQLDAGHRGIAAVLGHLGHGADRCLGHKESASHKVDPVPLEMSVMRAGVDRYLKGDTMSAADVARLEGKIDKLRERVERQIDLDYPFGTERVDRTGQRDPDGVEAPPAERWLIEAVLGVRSLLARDLVVDIELDGTDLEQLAELVADALEAGGDQLSDELADAVIDELERRQRARLEAVDV